MLHPDLPSTLQNRSDHLVLPTFHADIRKQAKSLTLLLGFADGILQDRGPIWPEALSRRLWHFVSGPGLGLAARSSSRLGGRPGFSPRARLGTHLRSDSQLDHRTLRFGRDLGARFGFSLLRQCPNESLRETNVNCGWMQLGTPRIAHPISNDMIMNSFRNNPRSQIM